MTDLIVERLEAHTVLILYRPEKRNALSIARRDPLWAGFTSGEVG
jgi:hypothetical protein